MTSLVFLLFVSAGFAQDRIEVSGVVTDAATNEPLIGVTVAEKGKKGNGTATDLNGHFALKVPSNGTLTFSYVGYASQEVPVEGQTMLSVALSENQQMLDEIVVIGYGVQKKADLTGAVAVVDMDEAKKTQATNIAEMLQGQAAGVSVQTTGNPGEMSNVRIRGIGSFSSVGPLYVIDGLIVNDVNHLNPQEIETMQVLKDASAAAIYGARGANGVIVITTKKGKKGKPTLDISANFSVADMPKTIKMKSTPEFMYYNEQSYINSNTAWPAAGIAAGTMLPNTDWQKAVFQVGTTQDYNLMYTQGTDHVNMAVGAGYLNQTGILEGPEYERVTARINTDATYGIFKIGENLTFQHTDNMTTNSGSFANALSTPPVIPVYDPNEPSGRGGFGYGSATFPTYTTNPVANQESIRNQQVNDRVIGNLFVELDIWKYFKYKFNFGVDAWFGRTKTINHCYTMRMASGEQRYNDILDDIRDQRFTLLMEHTLNYNQKIGKHTIGALVGYTTEDVNWNYLRNQGYNQKVDGLWQIDLVGEQNNMWGSQQERRMISYLARVDYNYDDRYLLQVNFRSDGCSKFGPEKRRGNFPSASLGWRISNEKFFEPLLKYVNNLKLRGSWGMIGDMQALGNYDYIPGIDHTGPYEGFWAIFGPSGNETLYQGATQSAAVNTKLGWETKTTTNIGLDFDLLNSRLYGSVEWFSSKSTDLLLNLKTAWVTGVSTKWTNYGEMRNSGFEFMVGWRDKVNDFSYSVSANLSTVRNEVIRLGDSYYESGVNNINRSEPGRSIGDFYLIQFDGIFQNMDEVFNHTTTLPDGTVKVIQPNAQPGDVRYVDANGDGMIDTNDRVWCGSPLPKLEGGLTFSCEWKGIDFNMFWAGRYGNKIFNDVRYATLAFTVDNLPADVNPWTWDNPSNEYPRMYSGSTDNNLYYVDRFLEDGSYLRLKNIQIGYTFPEKWLKKLSISRLRAYVGGSNLLTITKYKGYDPDIICTDVFGQGNDTGQYPSTRQLNVGLQVSF
ncbi:TonB-dependent receptor [uncultured Barnesiella sp.]|uniref:SusC/RagA family TonB-linked outer membrane protein n=1 Tax=uncultured Barnesiella sp. TaxID=584861 RepID=UPI00260DEC9D|nr:TonB-dependent receptor [uncultured Barnesiella sp.]